MHHTTRRRRQSRRKARVERGGDLPPGTDASVLKKASEKLRSTQALPERDVFGRLIPSTPSSPVTPPMRTAGTRRRRRRRGGAGVEEQLDRLDEILSPDYRYTRKAKDEMIAREEAQLPEDQEPKYSKGLWEDIFAALRGRNNIGETPLLIEFKENEEFQLAWNYIDSAQPPNNQRFPEFIFRLVRILRDLVAKKRASLPRSSKT